MRRRLPSAVRLELSIETLSLHGFAMGERDALLTAFQSELDRLIAERGLPRSDSVRLERVRLDGAPAASASDAGREAARGLYAQLRLAAARGGER